MLSAIGRSSWGPGDPERGVTWILGPGSGSFLGREVPFLLHLSSSPCRRGRVEIPGQVLVVAVAGCPVLGPGRREGRGRDKQTLCCFPHSLRLRGWDVCGPLAQSVSPFHPAGSLHLCGFGRSSRHGGPAEAQSGGAGSVPLSPPQRGSRSGSPVPEDRSGLVLAGALSAFPPASPSVFLDSAPPPLHLSWGLSLDSVHGLLGHSSGTLRGPGNSVTMLFASDAARCDGQGSCTGRGWWQCARGASAGQRGRQAGRLGQHSHCGSEGAGQDIGWTLKARLREQVKSAVCGAEGSWLGPLGWRVSAVMITSVSS